MVICELSSMRNMLSVEAGPTIINVKFILCKTCSTFFVVTVLQSMNLLILRKNCSQRTKKTVNYSQHYS